MKRHLVLIPVVALLLGAVALAQSGDGSEPSGLYVEEQGVASGASYRLTGLAWQVSGEARGGGYRLQSTMAPLLRGSGCCCTYVPILQKEP